MLHPGEPVTPDWVTTVLRDSGALVQGAVSGVEQEMTGAFNSSTSHLRLEYSPDASSGLPRCLVMKRNIRSAWGTQAGAEEVRFYRCVGSLHDHPPVVPRCYAAVSSEETDDSCILLQDLSATHRPPVTRDQQVGIVEGVPSAPDIASVVETLARLHAYWWQHPLIAAGGFPVGYWSRDEERFAAYLDRRTSSWKRLVSREGTSIPADVRALYEEVLTRLQGYWQEHLAPRFRGGRHLTLIHGDAYFSNFLCPIPPATRTYLLDWQSPTFDIGAYDLVNLCATFWTSEQRSENDREVTVLRTYHETLRAQGVTGYAWNELLRDYRWGLIHWLLVPVQDGADGSAPDYWWPKMRCLVSAFREWRCDRVLGM